MHKKVLFTIFLLFLPIFYLVAQPSEAEKLEESLINLQKALNQLSEAISSPGTKKSNYTQSEAHMAFDKLANQVLQQKKNPFNKKQFDLALEKERLHQNDAAFYVVQPPEIRVLQDLVPYLYPSKDPSSKDFETLVHRFIPDLKVKQVPAKLSIFRIWDDLYIQQEVPFGSYANTLLEQFIPNIGQRAHIVAVLRLLIDSIKYRGNSIQQIFVPISEVNALVSYPNNFLSKIKMYRNNPKQLGEKAIYDMQVQIPLGSNAVEGLKDTIKIFNYSFLDKQREQDYQDRLKLIAQYIQGLPKP